MMNKNFIYTFILLLMVIVPAGVKADNNAISITGSDSQGAFAIVSTNGKASIVVDAADAEVVRTAATAVRSDIAAVTGTGVIVKNTLAAGDLPIIAGTIGSSSFIDTMVSNGTLDVSDVKGQWESYGLQIVSNPLDGITKALVIYGADPRGTAYGLFELSRLMGVSPYIWWADVKPATMTALYATGTKTVVASPSVKYRGIFINDEDWGLLPWAKNTIDAATKNIGPKTYEKVFELLLRLRANTLWPAKHANSMAFWSLQQNRNLARKYDIVMSSGDSMLRDNLWEWTRFGGSSSNFTWNDNSEMIKRYWADRVGQSRGYDAIYDISMRGLQDVPLQGYSSQEEQIKGLNDVISYQRQLLRDSIGDPTTIPQIYIPYKEALDLYNAGLEIPEDVTLCWVDDNHGYIRQLPTATEQARSGGNGIYYHLSYLGTPASYLWLSSISPSLMSYELCKGYANGIRRFWMVNIGDIKPAEAEMEFFMELAWDVDRWTPEKAGTFTRYWAAKTFGADLADDINDIKKEYYHLAASGKPEHVLYVSYTYDEMKARLTAYRALQKRVEDLEPRIPERLHDAFFEMIAYPVKSACQMNIKTLGAKLSMAYASVGAADSALTAASDASVAYSTIQDLTDEYNNQTANGKWNGIMSMKPAGHVQFNMPEVATANDISTAHATLMSSPRTYVPAASYSAVRGNLPIIGGLGVSDSSLTVWPMDYTTYTAASARQKGPYAQYTVSLEPGQYRIVVRCMPSFPITPANSLRVGLSINDGAIQIKSVQTTAMSGKWNDTSIQGYSDAFYTYTASAATDADIKIYFMDPGLAVSDFYLEKMDDANELTSQLLVNPDFEQYESNGQVLTNTSGAIRRGVPYGWTVRGELSGNSYGINDDGSIAHGKNICWFKSTPMPTDFQLSQTISHAQLQPGVYRVSCLLWVQNGGYRGTCRLFANNQVEYYGNKVDYTKILTAGEDNHYACYEGGYTDRCIMQPMNVLVTIGDGDDLTLGIRSSNRKSDGTLATGSDAEGWFKVDHFTIEKVVATPSAIRSIVTSPSSQLRVYTLSGQRIIPGKGGIQSLPKGIYIINGRKQVIR
jgi:hypothetical protein